MPVPYAIGSDVFDRIKPKIRQWEINKQRRIDPNVLQSMLEAEMSVATKEADTRFFRGTELEQRQQALDAAEQARKDAKSAAAVQGGVNIATLGATGYLGYKGMQNQKTIAEAYKTMAGGKAGGGQIAVESEALNPPGTLTVPKDYSFGGGGPVVDAGGGGPLLDAAPYSGGPTIDMTSVGGEFGTTFAPSAEAGGLAVDSSMLPVAAGAQEALIGAPAIEGGQAALAAGEVTLAEAETAALAADAGVGGEMGAEALVAEGAGGFTVLPAAAGYIASGLINKYSPIGGQKEKSIAGNVAMGAGIGGTIGSAVPVIGTVIGAVVGGVIGLGVGLIEDASVVCSELKRQGRITEYDRKKCVIYRFRHISDDMFDAYLEWAAPHVEAMRRGGWRNAIRLPFAHAFVRYMIAVQDKREPSIAQRLVWDHAWRRCEAIARSKPLGVVKGVA